jgi:hypothetical protein
MKIMTNNLTHGDKSRQVFVALIGDIVGSRSHKDQRQMLGRLQEAVAEVNRRVPALQPLQTTIGDEFQGLYGDLADALRANLLLPMLLTESFEVRVGIGQGPVDVLSPADAPRGQSGPAWWFAREAIDDVHGLKKGWPAGTRSRFRGAEPTLSGLVNAFLVCQDQVVSRMDKLDCSIAAELILETPHRIRQVELAKKLSTSQSNISHRQRNNGPAALVRAFESLTGRSG